MSSTGSESEPKETPVSGSDVSQDTHKHDKGPYAICEKCKVSKLWRDDTHSACFKCRGGPFHSCQHCATMGPQALTKWHEFVTDKTKPPPPPSTDQFVTMGQFNTLLSSIQTLQNSVSLLTPVKITSAKTNRTDSIQTGVDGRDSNKTSDDSRDDSQLLEGSGTEPPRTVKEPPAGRSVAHKPGPNQPDLGVPSPTEAATAPRGLKRKAEHEILDLHPSVDDFDIESHVSNWDFKRGARTSNVQTLEPGELEDNVDPDDSVSQIGSLTDEPISTAKVDQEYIDVVTEMIKFLQIDGAEIKQGDSADITSSRVMDKSPKVTLPFAQSHKTVIDQVWSRPVTDLKAFKQSLTSRYQIADTDNESFLKVGTHDKLLEHALRREGVKFRSTKKNPTPLPVLPDPVQNKMEKRAWQMERQALLSMRCSVVQSWLIEFISKKLQVMDEFLKDKLAEHYDELVKETRCDFLPTALLLAQDAAMDQLDLNARIAANAKYQRRMFWLQPTKWTRDLSDQVLKFPIVSGKLFGDKLYETVHEFKEFDEALEHTEPNIKSNQSKDNKVKFVRHTVSSLAPPSKKQKTDNQTWQLSHNKGSNRGRGRGRGNKPFRSQFSDRSNSFKDSRSRDFTGTRATASKNFQSTKWTPSTPHPSNK